VDQSEERGQSLGGLPDMVSVGISDLEQPLMVKVRRRSQSP
jgi:hypothetical protein